MRLSVISKEREPESVAPKIKVFESEADLDAALPDLKDGAIVATKEDESSYGQPVEVNFTATLTGGATVTKDITLYPIGNDAYMWGTAVSFSPPSSSWSSTYNVISIDLAGFDFISYEASATISDVGPATIASSVGAKRLYMKASGSNQVSINLIGIAKRS